MCLANSVYNPCLGIKSINFNYPAHYLVLYSVTRDVNV